MHILCTAAPKTMDAASDKTKIEGVQNFRLGQAAGRLRSRRRRLPDFFWGRDMQAIFRSKRFWIAVSGVIAVAIGDRLPIDEDQIQQVVMLLAAWIVGDSLRQTTPPNNVYGGRR